MISLPLVTEANVHNKLHEIGYEPTEHVTKTGRFWRHRNAKLHLLVPNSAEGFYPDWLLDELAQRARAIGDQAGAETIIGISPWERLRARRRDKWPPNP